jgi:hypothetical protein
MSKLIRILIALSLVLGIVLLAQGQAAWAAPANIGNYDHDGPGTVKPPPRWLWACKDGSYSLGGVATLNVSNLSSSYCLRAFLWMRRWPPVQAPTGAGDFLADITFLQIFYRNQFKNELPVEDGTVKVCYAVPPGKQAKIYFLDFYGKHKGKPTWVALDTTVENGMAVRPRKIPAATR